MNVISGAGLRPVPGSFRDPRSRVFEGHDTVLRALSQRGRRDFEAAAAAPFFSRAVADGRIIESTVVERSEEVPEGWDGALRHPRLPMVSYPYEWSFSMLRDAALLQLELVGEGLADGIGCKDATPYNVQYVSGRPLFIDVGSFAPIDGDPWPGYRQFCQQFLYPLMIEAYVGVSFGTFLRGSLEGITPHDANRLLGGRHRLHRGVLTHVTFQAAAARRYAERPDPAATLVRGAGRGAEIGQALAARTAAIVERLPVPAAPSEWSDYTQRPHYEPQALRAKDAFVSEVVSGTRRSTVLDIGCNDGRYAMLAARSSDLVVAVDADRRVVDDLYRRLRSRGLPIVPLVGDVADPSPALGWDLAERPSLRSRVQPDLVLALAVMHHLVIGRNIPIGAFLDHLATSGDEVVLEVPHRDDPMVQRLLALKAADTHHDYRFDHIEAEIGGRFEVESRLELLGGTRTLFHLRSR